MQYPRSFKELSNNPKPGAKRVFKRHYERACFRYHAIRRIISLRMLGSKISNHAVNKTKKSSMVASATIQVGQYRAEIGDTVSRALYETGGPYANLHRA
ncbi:MAG TPA: hypothetical protein VMV49_02095 [Candidatus Deferrimicrobium sp.]|nr:hypothetical protein [Candidatus Deferrimicrobium sp.]